MSAIKSPEFSLVPGDEPKFDEEFPVLAKITYPALWLRTAWCSSIQWFPFPRAWEWVKERASEQISTAEHVSKASNDERVNEWAVKANGQVSGPVLTSRFSVVLDHSAILAKKSISAFGWKCCECPSKFNVHGEIKLFHENWVNWTLACLNR